VESSFQLWARCSEFQVVLGVLNTAQIIFSFTHPFLLRIKARNMEAGSMALLSDESLQLHGETAL